MKPAPQKPGLIFASLALLLVFGCHKKKPPVPQEAQAPTVTQPQTQPAQQPAEGTQPQNPPATEQPQTTANKPPEKPAPAHHPAHHPTNKKNLPAADNEKPSPATPEKTTTEAKNIPPRIVIQEGGANPSNAQPSPEQQDNRSTQQLLDGTDANLRNIKHDLSANEKSMLDEIRNYINQSKQATKDGDPVRAHTLAAKAKAMSDELVKGK